MRFMDEVLESPVGRDPFQGLEICDTALQLNFSEKSSRLVSTYFSHKKKGLFENLWESTLDMETIELMIPGHIYIPILNNLSKTYKHTRCCLLGSLVMTK